MTVLDDKLALNEHERLTQILYNYTDWTDWVQYVNIKQEKKHADCDKNTLQKYM